MAKKNEPKQSPAKNLTVGDRAPAFTANNQDDESVRLSEYKGSYVLLYFYPKDNTPGCTTQAIEFTAHLKKFEKLDCHIFGISPDSVKSHEGFRKKQKLKVDLLSDEDKKLCEKYGVWVEKSLYGRKFMGVQRASFLINPKGKIIEIWPKVKAKGHAEAVLEYLKGLDE
jgi:peroxiredoxin Q/BCP